MGRWIAGEILPHEADVRAWLRRSLRLVEIDDVIQESYCRIAAAVDPQTIASPRAYFFTTARNVALDQMRKNRVVGLDDVAELAWSNVVDESPSPERLAGGRLELRRINTLIESLPQRCRTIFVMRKVQGLSQRQIAHKLGVTENVVEKQAAKGLRLLLDAVAAQPGRVKLEQPIQSDRRRRG
ncbi:sigma-70 family RNA polymerase sigma factor [Caulobacter segnis]|uniref:RNA polymerase sigma factor n=1 Tax=Caulobacter segnis TaxID=88688 RepID=UPI00240FD72D|nr:sigma-70 family RNA polymerase sigma factor [Caulobacter segnis]MDG2520719.1 sigma-70 family RNA polymerase sigma factor [Caulobacter segnis]